MQYLIIPNGIRINYAPADVAGSQYLVVGGISYPLEVERLPLGHPQYFILGGISDTLKAEPEPPEPPVIIKDMIRAFKDIYEEQCRHGATYCFVNPNIVDDAVELTLTDDPTGIVPFGVPRPTSGDFLGYFTNDSFSVNPGQRLKADATLGPNPTHYVVESEEPVVSGDLLFNNSWTVRYYLGWPGNYTGTKRYFGGMTELAQYPMLAITTNVNDKKNVKIRLFWRGIFQAPEWKEGSDKHFEPVRMEFKLLPGYVPGSTVCFRIAGSRHGVEYDIDIYSLAPVNILADPIAPNTAPAPIRTRWNPAITMF